jgi:hypothetical protein
MEAFTYLLYGGKEVSCVNDLPYNKSRGKCCSMGEPFDASTNIDLSVLPPCVEFIITFIAFCQACNIFLDLNVGELLWNEITRHPFSFNHPINTLPAIVRIYWFCNMGSFPNSYLIVNSFQMFSLTVSA